MNIDLYCRVIDNFGDAGVCWRLARQMTQERGWKVRLVVDRIDVLACLAPAVDVHRNAQRIAGIEIRRWPERGLTDPGDVVVEAFGCRLPDESLDAMVARSPPPIWINLEYLTAETWIDDCHGLPSPDPRRALTRFFFFPGFSLKSGGLPYERCYSTTIGHDTDNTTITGLLKTWGIHVATEADPIIVSLFSYPDSPVAALKLAWQSSPRPILCLLPAGSATGIANTLGVTPTLGAVSVVGRLTTCVIPFLPQDDYDRLLQRCTCNFVRGEDSFLRAQWAERPFIWQPYRQAENHHHVKLTAFLDRYTAGLPKHAASAARALALAWSGALPPTVLGPAWHSFARHVIASDATYRHASQWRDQLLVGGTLVERLANFVEDKVK